jgi:hypothetical protein
MLPKFPKFPTIPTIPTKILWILPAPLIGLILMAGHPGLRLAGLVGLGGLAVPAHTRLAGKRTAKILALAESRWSEDLIAARAAGVAEGRSTERELARVAAQTHAQETIARAQDELMAGYQRMEQELAAALTARDDAIALKDRSLKIAQQYKAKHDTIARSLETERQSLKRWESELQATADRLQTQIEQSQLDSQRQELTHAQIVAALERKIAAAQDRIDSLESALAAAQQAIAQSEQQASQSIAQATAAANDKIRAIATELERYKKQESDRLAAEQFDQSLPSITDKIGREFKPVIVCGGQGSGKATTAIAILNHYAGAVGCIPFVLDVSEGGQPDSTWARANVPSTDDPKLFIDLMTEIELNLGSRKHRTDPGFSNQPPIIFVIDELQTVALSLPIKAKDDKDKYTRENFINLVRVWHTRGAKYGCYLFACNQSDQIQNMRAGTLQIFNGGHLADFHVIRLNDVLRDRIAREPGLAADSLGEYLERNQGKYIASFQTVIAGGKQIEPITHPSHHGQQLGDRTPTRLIPIPILAPCPAAAPIQSRAIYSRYCRTIAPTANPTPSQQQLTQTKPPTNPTRSPLETAIQDFALAVGGSISARDFIRNGGKFHAGARSLKADQVVDIFKQLERQGAGQTETTPRGAVKYRATQTASA